MDLKQIKTSKQLDSVLGCLADAAIVINKKAEIQYCNQATLELFGYSMEELLGSNVSMLMGDPYESVHDSYVQHYLDTGEKKIIGTIRELNALTKEKESFLVELSVNDLNLSDEWRFLGMIRDITERKRIDKIRDDLIAIVSHELRTPITSIKGTLGLLSNEKVVNLNDQGASLVKVARSNCERLVRLLNDMLDMEKIKSGKLDLKLKKESLIQIVETSCEHNQGYADSYNVHIQFNHSVDKADSLCDADKINQVITNLLSNAIKYSPTEGTIHVDLHDFGEQFVISIRDEGEGISKEDQKSIFNAFSQVDSTSTRQKGGTGLGLTISKSIVEMHNGEIGLNSDLGAGTTFHFSMPKYIELNSDSSRKVIDKTILMHERDQEASLVLKYTLEKLGYSSRYVMNTQLLKSEMNANHYSALLLDCNEIYEPIEDLIAEIRTVPEYKNLMIMLLVEVVKKSHRKLQEQDEGPIVILQKPLDEHDLEHALNTLN